MDKIILGLLLSRPLTSYELRAIIKNKFSMMCSDSAGSLQVALKKLLEAGLIEFTEYVENGKNKKKYTITLQGLTVFNDWATEPMNHNKSKNIELSKLFFMGLIEKSKRLPLLQEYVSRLRDDWYILTSMKSEIMSSILKQTPEETIPESIQYQLTTLDYGIALFQFEIDWYEKKIGEIAEGRHP